MCQPQAQAAAASGTPSQAGSHVHGPSHTVTRPAGRGGGSDTLNLSVKFKLAVTSHFDSEALNFKPLAG